MLSSIDARAPCTYPASFSLLLISPQRLTFHGIFGLCSWYSPFVRVGRGSPGGPRRGSIVVSAPGGVPLRTLAVAALIPLLALAALGGVITFLVPVSAEDALAHSQGFVGESCDIFVWQCPDADGLGYVEETLEMHVDVEDFLASAHDGLIRQSTKLAAADDMTQDGL